MINGTIGTDAGERGVQEQSSEKRTGESHQDQPHGIVLAGVQAWGDCLLEGVASRPMLPVASRPLIWHVLDWLRAGGIKSCTVCGNGGTAVLRDSIGDGRELGIAVTYVEDAMPRGPGGCARDAMVGSMASRFVVVDGTILPEVDLAELIAVHERSEAIGTIAVAGAADGAGRQPHEPVGISVFSRTALEAVPAKGYQDIKETLIPELYRRGERISAHIVPRDSSLRVTDAASYLSLNMRAVQRATRSGSGPDGLVRRDEAWVAPSARIAETARLVGPVLVGPGSEVQGGAVIVGPTSIGRDCSVGPRAVVSRSVVWDGCAVGSGALVDHCILPDGARVEPNLVVRETVFIPPRQAERGFLGRWLPGLLPASGRRSTKDSPRSGTGWSSVPVQVR